MITKYDNIVFDLGGVIVDIDPQACIDELNKIGLYDAAKIIDPYKQQGAFLELEEGKITAAEFYDIMRSMCNNKEISNKELEDAFCSFIPSLPVERLKALRELRKTKKVYALSNTNAILFNNVIDRLFRQEGLAINDYFDGIVTSFADQACKPSKKIFETLTRRYNLDGSRTLFLDDSQANCDAAKECGIDSALVPPGVEFTEILNNIQ